MDESDYLEQCWEQLQSEWLFSDPQYQNNEALSSSLEHIEYASSEEFMISFSAGDFFQHCWADNISIATTLQPRFLVIALDHNDRLYDSEEFLELWQQTPCALPLKIAFPLWDLSDQPFFNTRELRGKLSQNYRQFLSRYDAQSLMILRGQLNEDHWDLRIISPTEGDQAYLCGCSMSDIVLFLRTVVLEQYHLSQVPQTSIISFARQQQKGMNMLQEAPEVISLQPRMMTSNNMEFRLWSYWTEKHTNLLEEEYGLTVLPDPH